jgi:CubicO group peptidase (beta-lactamase class C family)
LLIIQGGAIRFEKYLLGNDGTTRWMSMSVVKSIAATLVGAAVQDGLIGSLDDLVVKYLPRFSGSAYDGVTIRQLLMMA